MASLNYNWLLPKLWHALSLRRWRLFRLWRVLLLVPSQVRINRGVTTALGLGPLHVAIEVSAHPGAGDTGLFEILDDRVAGHGVDLVNHNRLPKDFGCPRV